MYFDILTSLGGVEHRLKRSLQVNVRSRQLPIPSPGVLLLPNYGLERTRPVHLKMDRQKFSARVILVFQLQNPVESRFLVSEYMIVRHEETRPNQESGRKFTWPM